MFCIAAFIIFAILGIFSAKYRPLAKKAWGCVAKRITFRPCDVSLTEELKGKLLGKTVLTHPRLTRVLEKWIDFLAFVFVVLTIWSLAYVLISGLNYLVYDTCKPKQAESCSLGGEACGVSFGDIGFIQSVKEGKVLQWAHDDLKFFGETVTRIPDRFKKWDATSFATADSTYYKPFDPGRPVALEVIDPGCKFCAKLFDNIKQAGFEDRYNLTYIAYPIPDPKAPNGYKFVNSYLMASYLEATKQISPAVQVSNTPPDWQILEQIFTGVDSDGIRIQDKFNTLYSAEQAKTRLQEMLKLSGYRDEQISQIASLADSEQIKNRLADNKNVVEEQIHTVKIPTIMFGGRRYDRVVDVDKLK